MTYQPGDRVCWRNTFTGAWWSGTVAGTRATPGQYCVIFDHIPTCTFDVYAQWLVPETVEIEEVPF
jgi:hypothetical protein